MKTNKKFEKNKIKDIHFYHSYETAQIVSKINPYMKDKSVDEIYHNMVETVRNVIINSNTSYVSTAGWLATIEEESEGVYNVDFYVSSRITHKYLFSNIGNQ